MKTTKALFGILTVIAALAMQAHAQFNYTINADLTVTITGYTGPSGAVIIPPMINGLLVTSIGGSAFLGSGVTSVTIPNSVTSIGAGAFWNCGSLTSITIPNGVTFIADGTFYECVSLASVTIPNNVTTIGSHAFDGCTSLASVTIPSRVTTIGDSAFSGSGLTSVTIPNSVTSIGAGAFWNCGSLTSITIPNGVTFIVDGTFYACVSLTSVTIPNSVTTIGSSAFYDCTRLAIVTIPSSVTTVGDSAFADCTNLAGVYFRGNTPSLGGTNVFSGANHSIIYSPPGIVGWGTSFAGRPVLPCNPQVQDSSVGVRANQFGFTFTGSYGMLVVVEASRNLANPVWVPVQTNTLGVGSTYFNDPQCKNYPGRFYRLRSP
jgi:deoxycytidine triphosphate deaminase